MNEFLPVMPFPKTQAEMYPRSNGAACRVKPVWKQSILNVWSIQILATVACFRGNVRSCRSGSMPLVEEKVGKRKDQHAVETFS